MNRSGLRRVVKSTRGRKGSVLRSYWVKTDSNLTAPKKKFAKPDLKKTKMLGRAWKNHVALNFGQGVRDARLFASDVAYHAKRLSSDAYYGVITPWGPGGHTREQVEELSHGSFSDWYRKGRNS